MNKTERSKLGFIIAEMIYDFGSSLQLVDVGERLLSEFPSVRGDVDHSRYGIAYYNVLGCIRSSIYDNADPSALSRAACDIASKTYDTLESVFDHFIETLDGNNLWPNGSDQLSWMIELEGKYSSTNNHSELNPITSELINTNEWRESVLEFYDEGTDEYKYLICQYKV
jgi:hypothetical protein